MARSLSRGALGAELTRLWRRVQVAKGPTAPVEEALGRFAKAAAAAAESADPQPEAEAQPAEPQPQPEPQEEVQDEAWALRMRAEVEAHKTGRS